MLDYLAAFRFEDATLDYLRSGGRFTEDFLNYLASLRFTGSLRGVPEGRLFFADEPILEITAPLVEAQLVETFVINQINLQVMLATKAADAFGPPRADRCPTLPPGAPTASMRR